MIYKYTYGKPLATDAVVQTISDSNDPISYFQLATGSDFSLTRPMDENDLVFGLGENMRGINKRGHLYKSNCTDDATHTESTNNLYAAHNFLIVHSSSETFGVFIDTPAEVTFDIGYEVYDTLRIHIGTTDFVLYYIVEDNILDIITTFRELIGESYIPPKWAFGYGQSRWEYRCEEDILEIVQQHKNLDLPLDAIYLDIDYMDSYKDFTVNSERFPDLSRLTKTLAQDGIHLVPIIDAAVKIETGYDVYEEGIQNNYFCMDANQKPFVMAAWPGRCHLPDFMNQEAAEWFGNKYRFLTDQGIDGFWNDMNEPAIFYTERGIEETISYFESLRGQNVGVDGYFGMYDAVAKIANNPVDYKNMYHNFNGTIISHDKVHNLYGFYMTRSAADGLANSNPDKRFLLFSRSSHIGMHRYSGIWTGDNCSWWQHLLLNVKMMPSLNMCGFLYSGADLGGFGANTTYDLLVRWLQFGIFTPLMRNHSTLGTRRQELYQFEDSSYFKELLQFRYALMPYLYSEFVKSAKRNRLLFTPLSFLFPNDNFTTDIEDQLMLGESIMIAPITAQNALGRYVYLPEPMLMIQLKEGQQVTTKIYEKGHHYIKSPLKEFFFFIRKDCLVPFCNPANQIAKLDTNRITLCGFQLEKEQLTYELYDDDGYTTHISENSIEQIGLEKEGSHWILMNPLKTHTLLSCHIKEYPRKS